MWVPRPQAGLGVHSAVVPIRVVVTGALAVGVVLAEPAEPHSWGAAQVGTTCRPMLATNLVPAKCHSLRTPARSFKHKLPAGWGRPPPQILRIN